MSNNLNKYILAALMLAATPMSVAWGHPAKTYADLHASEPALAADQARIYLYRESSMLGGAIQPEIKINGEDTGGDSRSGDYFYVDRPAGTYEISTTTEKKEALTVTLAAGQSVYVRFNVSMGFLIGHVLPSLIDTQEAAEEIKDCDYKAPKPVAGAPANAAPAAPATEPPKSDAPKTNP